MGGRCGRVGWVGKASLNLIKITERRRQLSESQAAGFRWRGRCGRVGWRGVGKGLIVGKASLNLIKKQNGVVSSLVWRRGVAGVGNQASLNLIGRRVWMGGRCGRVGWRGGKGFKLQNCQLFGWRVGWRGVGNKASLNLIKVTEPAVRQEGWTVWARGSERPH